MSNFDRRGFVASLAGACATAAADGARAQTPATPPVRPRFGFDEVVRRARDLSTAPLSAPPALPEALARLDPEAARDIKFRIEKSFLAGGRFRLQPIHLDPKSARSVTVNLIRDGIATPIPYSASLFEFGRAKFERPLPLNLGFAGLRLQYPLNEPGRFEDALTFSASSQFSFIGRGQRAGAALRALAVNAGLENEEFPFFREFWLQTPDAAASTATIYALLDGASVTGAFRFQATPGAEAALEVSAVLFPRRIGGQFGIAPIASMYYLGGEGGARSGGEFRPEVHNSDGLAMRAGNGEWLWRPLRNPGAASKSAFADRTPRGFGLLQRDRAFDHYQDLEQAFEMRPSYWVEPAGDWGEGRIELLERPAADGQGENILAAWVANEPREPGKQIKLAYKVTASLGATPALPTGRAVNTFQSAPSGVEAGPLAARRFLVDFSGGDLAYHLGGPAGVEAVASAGNGRIIQSLAVPNPHIRGFRAVVDVEAATGQTADLRLFLRAGGRVLTETWTMPWTA